MIQGIDPYSPRPTATQLPDRRILAFLDILGFRSIVRRMETDLFLYSLVRDNLDDIRNELEKQRASLKEADAEKIDDDYGYRFPLEQTQFSDSLVISASAARKTAAGNVIYAASHLADRMMLHGIFMRGGISSGWCYHEDSIVFGQAMIDAYELESQVAHVPRIVLSDEVVELLSKFDREYHVGRDVDGISYLLPFRHHWSGRDIAIPDPDQLNIIREHISTGLEKSKSNYSLITKYRWLAGRFNEHSRSCNKTWWQQELVSPIEF